MGTLAAPRTIATSQQRSSSLLFCPRYVGELLPDWFGGLAKMDISAGYSGMVRKMFASNANYIEGFLLTFSHE